MYGRKGVSQRLLFPEMVTFSSSDATLLEEVHDELDGLGFELSSLGGGSFSVLGIPAGIEGTDCQRLLGEMISNLRESGQGLEDETEHRVALTMARNAAIPNGQVLSQQEMETLIQELMETDDPNRTPDGFPIISLVEHEKVERMFK